MKQRPVRVALSGDLVGSRKTLDRAALAQRFRATFRSLGQRFEGALLAAPVLTRGLDEFSAAFKGPEPIFDFFVALNEAVWPHRFRVGAGVGAIDVAERSKDAARMDGPAFHRAAEALALARASGNALRLVAPGAAAPDVAAIEALALAHAALVENWSKAAARTIPALRRHGTQERAAKALDATQQAISKAAIRGHHATLLALEQAATGLLGSRVPMVAEPTPEE